ncbi:MAG TPA: hypothetical protein ENN38_04135 [Actinobacteria bacterium]|nr:hypothetical protein [Actinomycetota bacterium]
MKGDYKSYLTGIGILLSTGVALFGAIGISQNAKSGRYESAGIFFTDLLCILLFLAVLLSILVAVHFFNKHLKESDRKESEECHGNLTVCAGGQAKNKRNKTLDKRAKK